MKKVILLISIGLFVLSCSSIQVNRGVTADNIYFSEKLPAIRIAIDNRFIYSPQHPVAKKHESDFFLDRNTNEHVLIRVYHGDYAPENSFNNKNMVSIEKQKIGGKLFYVGTEVYKSNAQYFLKRIHLHYPNSITMLIVMHTRPLSLYEDSHDWSDIAKLSDKQEKINRDFVDENIQYVRFIE